MMDLVEEGEELEEENLFSLQSLVVGICVEFFYVLLLVLCVFGIQKFFGV